MSKKKIAVLVGSIRKDSFNKQLAVAIEKIAGGTFEFVHVDIAALPLYNQDADAQPVIDSVAALRETIKSSDGVLFVTPEYNRSFSGALKNALDQGSRPWGQSVWAGKPAGVIGVSLGAIGTALAQQHLRNVLAYLDMPTLGQPEAFIQYNEGLFNDDGSIGPDSAEFVGQWVEAFTAFVNSHGK